VKLKIEIDEYELWNLLLSAISNNAKWPECCKAGLPANRIMHKLKELCSEYKIENANSGYPLLADGWREISNPPDKDGLYIVWRVKMKNDLISKEDYIQVFEETIMSALDGWALLAVKSENEKFLEIMITWSKYYWRKHGGDILKKCEDVKI